MAFVLRSTVLAAACLALLGSAPPTRSLEVRLERSRAFAGRSGALRVRIMMPGQAVEVPLKWDQPRPADARYRWVGVYGTSESTPSAPLTTNDLQAPGEPGIYELEISGNGTASRLSDARLLVKVPFNTKSSGRIGAYRIGSYPTANQSSSRYAPPEGLIEVTRENQQLRVSDHFTLREFLTHDQPDVWPKYVIVSPTMLDKLELVMTELSASGVPAHRMVVMSGYRTPQYNERGLSNGRAKLSRHQYGDAADVWVDNDGDWYIDDLNRDGRRDTGDARVMLRAVDAVEQKFPELLGGAGLYRDNGAHGPFIHIDTRGSKARW
ncbi:MAG TPA: D-Ala-D-Ala carboxypeptidase family metallohydrolase [Longimicrobiales bacterium]